MNARVAHKIDERYSQPSDHIRFFTDQELFDIRKMMGEREFIRTALNSCDTNLFMGVFFDGTGNNFEDSLNRQDYSYSNVARLYSAHPRLGVRRYVITPTFMAKDMT